MNLAPQLNSSTSTPSALHTTPALVERIPAAFAPIALQGQLEQLNSAHAWLALCADKDVLRARTSPGLLQFAARRDYWLAFADPAGSRQGRAQVLSEFLLRARSAGAMPVFYQADAQTAAEMARHGYRAWKLGEEARVPLTGFSLDGGERKAIRQNVRKLEREGLRFELSARPDQSLLATCAAVSQQWLADKRAAEKRFSLGQFDPVYLSAMPMALVWRGSELQAFANVLTTADHSILSVDLMRQVRDAPRGCMDLLFARLMEWGAAQGFVEFSLGMAPLANVESDPSTPNWSRLARLVRRFGERHYNFQGVRRFKQKWQPNWVPRYLLCPRRRDFLPVLLECAVTIAGGKRALLGFKRKSAARSAQ